MAGVLCPGARAMPSKVFSRTGASQPYSAGLKTGALQGRGREPWVPALWETHLLGLFRRSLSGLASSSEKIC